MLMILTEEERIRVFRVDKAMHAYGLEAQLYRDLTKRDFFELSEDWQKCAIVGGQRRSDAPGDLSGGADGSWAHYYRLLQRSERCYNGIQKYLRTNGRTEVERRIQSYEPGTLLPIERESFDRAFAFGVNHFGVTTTRNALTALRDKYFGQTALPWTRFLQALDVRPFQELMYEELTSASLQREKNSLLRWRQWVMSRIIRRDINDWDAVCIVLQPDGPLRRACQSGAEYTRTLAPLIGCAIVTYKPRRFINFLEDLEIYENYPCNEWIFSAIEPATDWSVLAYLAATDLIISERTGDRRRIERWTSPTQAVYELTRASRPKLQSFLATLCEDEMYKDMAAHDCVIAYRFDTALKAVREEFLRYPGKPSDDADAELKADYENCLLRLKSLLNDLEKAASGAGLVMDVITDCGELRYDAPQLFQDHPMLAFRYSSLFGWDWSSSDEISDDDDYFGYRAYRYGGGAFEEFLEDESESESESEDV